MIILKNFDFFKNEITVKESNTLDNSELGSQLVIEVDGTYTGLTLSAYGVANNSWNKLAIIDMSTLLAVDDINKNGLYFIATDMVSKIKFSISSITTGNVSVFGKLGYKSTGTTETDLSNYYNKQETDLLLDKKVDKTDFEILKNKVGDEKLDIGDNLSDAINKLLQLINDLPPTPPITTRRYGMRINLNDSNPDTRVEYVYDAVGMKPAKMDFVKGVFDYGDWGNIWFVKNNRPVMLKYDGTVDCELDHNNLTKKLDGTPSNISNSNYEGNAMSEIPLIWVKRYAESNYDYIIFCEKQYDCTYKAYAHTDSDGNILPVTYFPIYEGAIISDKLRSLSNQTVTTSKTDEQETTAAQQNGARWDKLSYSECNLMYEMCTIISMSSNSQEKFGQGCCNAVEFLKTGTMNTTGQFYGYNSTTNGIKLFYCENFFGNYWKRIRGFLNMNGKLHLKFVPPYSSVGTDYINTEMTPSGTNGGYYNKMFMTDGGRVPLVASGSETTFECDGLWFNNAIAAVAMFGGPRGHDSHCGLSYWSLYYPPTATSEYFGSSLSYQPIK